MGILDGIVEWIAEQVMAGLDLVTTSVLGALGCDMAVFLRYFPAAETMYSVFVALAIGIILLNWVWQLFKNFGLGAGVEAEDPVKLSIRSVIFILLTLFSDEIVNIVLTIGGTPYHWIMESDLPALSFADFNSVMLVIIGVCANGAVALISQFHAALGVTQAKPQLLIGQFQLQHFLIGFSGHLMAQKFERVKARHLVQFCHCRNCFVHHRHRITFFVHVGNSFLT